jgi:predicted metal-dependent enzyme (double-stranded beta helix superfamily)
MSRRGDLDTLAAAVRAAVTRRSGWRETARLVASELERHLPSPSILTAEQRAGDPETFRSLVLHSEPDGSFSIVALVWRPGQMTRIHDHVTWGAFAVIQGVEHEELFTLDEAGACLVEVGSTVNATGDVTGFAPPGDIHRVRNAGNRTAISIHIYGTDVSRLGSSVRHDYDLPVLPARAAA